MYYIKYSSLIYNYMPSILSFSKKFTFQQRLNESNRVMFKFSDRIPIICEKNQLDFYCPDIDKHKYLVPRDITIGQFMVIIRKRINLASNDSLFLFINNSLFSNNITFSSIYDANKNEDGFLYVTYSKENTFGF